MWLRKHTGDTHYKSTNCAFIVCVRVKGKVHPRTSNEDPQRE